MKNKSELFKKIIWLFVVGCIIGFVLETFWYFLKHGILINKQGVLYGPFKPVYGFGILAVTLIFEKIKTKSNTKIFLFGILIGSIYEYVLSLFQEFVLGTSTWNYSAFAMNLNGRIYIPYCIGWGCFALIWMQYLYPTIKKWINKIPLWFSTLVAIFMISNLIVSGLAVYEYANRANQIKPRHKILKVMDKLYDDEVMKKKFPKLKVIKKD